MIGGLFADLPDDAVPVDAAVDPQRGAASSVQADEESESAWQEVPQALFLSWSPARQAAYCAARDEDSAEHSLTYDEALWYLARAKSYKEMTVEACHD